MVVREERLMDKLERFKQLSDAMPMETKLELYQAEVSELIKTIDVDEEFDDVELDAIALVAIAGGKGRNSHC
ncbi:hypothetical protein [Synechococcus sp. UW140]|uniref:hypothetical protein n=1 Tax=Synechococcus sp. UW140 TaxID=368503 RepID=UPI001A7E0DE0|nr:hypothetical protein [Synechococcus sp. UW140]